jgi:hypothetical protein
VALVGDLGMRGLMVLVLTLATTAALTGCGSLGELTGRVEQPQLLTKRDIERYPESSPARAVLEWWRALQFDNPAFATRYYAARVELTPKRLERKLAIGPDLLNLKARLRVVDVIKKGRTATVLVLLTKVMRHPNGRADKARVPQAFNLVHEGGNWRLSDNRYIDRVVRNVKIFIEKAGRPKKQGSGPDPDR